MALPIRVRPVIGPTLRYLLANSSKTFTSRTHMSSPSSVSFIGYRSVVAEKQYRYYPLINSNQIRLSSNEVAVEAKATDPIEGSLLAEGARTFSSQELNFVDKSLGVNSQPELAPTRVPSVYLKQATETSTRDDGSSKSGNPALHWLKTLAIYRSASIELVPIEEVSAPVITGAILPFTHLNFAQQLFFPYTYALMYYLDFMTGYLPWWGAIIATTATARLLFFPLVVRQNVIGIKVNNILPETQKIQKQLNEAMCSGDAYGQAIAKTKLQNLYKEHGITLKERLMPVFIQAPLYMSFFFLLRKLTNIPVEGLTTGGILWFTDLTVADPYYILPLLTSTSMFILLEYGLEGSANPSLMSPIGRYIMRAIPIGLFAVTYSFPAATLLFWTTSNLFTLSYALIMKTALFKRKFNIPARKVIDVSQLPMTQLSFSGQVKAAMEKSQARKTSMDVRRLDDIAFRKAGIGPLRKTYKESPKARAEGSI